MHITFPRIPNIILKSAFNNIMNMYADNKRFFSEVSTSTYNHMSRHLHPITINPLPERWMPVLYILHTATTSGELCYLKVREVRVKVIKTDSGER